MRKPSSIVYLITLDDGFRILYRDSGGRVTDYERAAMARVGRVDLAIAAVSADYLNPPMVKQALEYMRTYKPAVMMPAHHDAPRSRSNIASQLASTPSSISSAGIEAGTTDCGSLVGWATASSPLPTRRCESLLVRRMGFADAQPTLRKWPAFPSANACLSDIGTPMRRG